ncbi:Tn7-like element transposition protein TnsE [Marivirga salinae]|uniref:Tn7-like element transposition protein TnsE n=1 Tax=Marivirga salinarum TaxID=3059078 RepID=A0AA49J9L1_9BACT|nr:Tn7-like element transposition protein TnsE [Marivirga sp. BDSF4-3]WKK77093.2 Tn7-like element transposition protein TnsE [Marivirga sp. BDSF4-3]
MAFEVISVPNAVFSDDQWQLETEVKKLGIKPYYQKEYFPVDRTPNILIGGEIENFEQLNPNAFPKEDLLFQDFGKGDCINFRDLKTGDFDFSNPRILYNESMIYRIEHNGEYYAFFCYDLFRVLLFITSEIGSFIFKNEFLEIALDHCEIIEEDSKKKLILQFNDFLPINLLKNQNFIFNVAYLLFCKPVKKYWDDIKFSPTISKRDFSFSQLNLKDVKMNVCVKKYAHFNLVLQINDIDINETLPFEVIKVILPELTKTQSAKDPSDKKKKGLENEFPIFPDVSKKGHNQQKRRSKIPISIGNNFVKKRPKIVYKRSASNNRKPRKSNTYNKNIPNKELRFSFGGKSFDVNNVKAKLESNLHFKEFDYSKIPNGLFTFCKAFEITANGFDLSFKYEIRDVPEHLVFSNINGQKRKILIIEVTDPDPFFLLEVDSSDGKYISTLVFEDVENIEKEEFLEKVILKMSANGGVWPAQYLADYSRHWGIRHPRGLKSKKSEDQENYEKVQIKLVANLKDFFAA